MIRPPVQHTPTGHQTEMSPAHPGGVERVGGVEERGRERRMEVRHGGEGVREVNGRKIKEQKTQIKSEKRSEGSDSENEMKSVCVCQ